MNNYLFISINQFSVQAHKTGQIIFELKKVNTEVNAELAEQVNFEL